MTDNNQLPLTERHLKAIGLLFIRQSMLESVIMDWISQLTTMSPLCTIITVEHQQFSSKILTLVTLCNMRLREHPNLDEILEHINDAKEVNDLRNTLAHAYWTFGEDDIPLAVRYYARGKLERKRTPMPPEKIEKAAEKAQSLRLELQNLRKELDLRGTDVP